jgi:hypothetical protein
MADVAALILYPIHAFAFVRNVGANFVDHSLEHFVEGLLFPAWTGERPTEAGRKYEDCRDCAQHRDE